jgi:signal peptidase I
MKILERITTSLSFVILAVCCGALLLFGISKTGWEALAIPTGSMRPTIPPGSLVLVHSVPDSTLKVGDVITYANPLNPKTTISHRIIKKYFIGHVPAFVTKGDANKIADVPVTAGSVKGKVIWHVPHIGTWLLESKKPIVLLPIVYIAAVLLMAEEVKRLSDYLKLKQPYRLIRYMPQKKRLGASNQKAALGVTLTIMASVVIGAVTGSTAFALLRSNTVVLSDNRLSVAAVNRCSGSSTNNTSVTVTNNSSQTATSGSVSSSGNTNGGSASSGSASNSNSTSTTVNITNC